MNEHVICFKNMMECFRYRLPSIYYTTTWSVALIGSHQIGAFIDLTIDGGANWMGYLFFDTLIGVFALFFTAVAFFAIYAIMVLIVEIYREAKKLPAAIRECIKCKD